MSRDGRLRSQRRTVMQALGAGATLWVFGGSAAAQQEDDPDEGGGAEEGDGTGDGNGGTGGETGTVHTVETLIRGPPTNPNRPADFFYQPTGLHVQPGDVIKWVFTTPDHNVVPYHPAFGMRRRVPTGVTAFSSPLLGWRPESIPGDQIEPPAEMGAPGEAAGEGDDVQTPTPTPSDGAEEEDGGGNGSQGPVPDTWLQAFETPGVYDMLCSPHEGFGMAMRVVVGDVTETEFETSDPEALPEPRAGPVELARVTLTDPALQPSTIVSEGSVAWEDLQANQGGGAEGAEGGGNETSGNESEGYLS